MLYLDSSPRSKSHQPKQLILQGIRPVRSPLQVLASGMLFCYIISEYAFLDE
ncbi:hypothetical protein SLEP1_g12292 [Rubroshorea leprosula]|uniref:Uncharacterized protein n=1 Tax=Rubroshorea leprosula TaxID=152421 RepID=A0AAV5IGI8_9ROSI|nr:hypothetical protein SLEP1_g12292 [Rubroshorea leprosula]